MMTRTYYCARDAMDDELGVQWRTSRFSSSIVHPILRESHGSQEFHRTGGFDGAWPMTLAPELAKLKGCWDWWANMWRKNGQNMWVKHGKTVFAMEKTWKNPGFHHLPFPHGWFTTVLPTLLLYGLELSTILTYTEMV